MWLVMSDAFLSIVSDPDHPSELLVRARLPNDINRVFPDAQLFSLGNFHDYKYRAYVARETVAMVIAQRLTNIDYRNFKNTVDEPERHNAYLGIWHEMHQVQK